MPFVNEILKYKSLSIVGLEKNTGKTECLNYILKRLPVESRNICVTSIGLDGERVDQVTATAKPEITLKKGYFFATGEKHYKSRNILSELLDISDETTPLGRIVTARALSEGKILLSGPSSTASLKRWMEMVGRMGVDLTIVDGAISRMSTASPAVSEAMILSTGAAYSANLPTLLQKTAFIVDMMHLPIYTGGADEGDDIVTVSSLAAGKPEIGERCTVLKISGALTDRFLSQVAQDKRVKGLDVVVKDFTRIFATRQTYNGFIKAGGRLMVENAGKLLAVCVNPVAPNGYVLDSDRLCNQLAEKIGLPVYDVVKNRYDET